MLYTRKDDAGPVVPREKKGIPKKWCPEPGCFEVTVYLRSHLCHFHKMKPGALLETSLRLARKYRGSKEARLL